MAKRHKVEMNEYEKLLKDQFPMSFNSKTVDNILDSPWLLYNEIIGGIPLGTIISIQSEPGSGKTTLMAQISQHLQQHGHRVVYIDTEYSMSVRRMKQLGLDINKVTYLQPPTLNEQYSLIYKLLKLKIDMNDEEPIVFAFDSITQTPTIEEIQNADTDKENASPQIKARMNSKNLPVLLKLLSTTNSTLIMINQTRTNIKMSPFSMGQPDQDIVGGQALKFYPTQDIRLRNGSVRQTDKWDIEGRIIKFKQNKNRIMSPLIEFPLVLDFQKGFVNSLSNYVFLSDLTKAEWKQINLTDPIPFRSNGGFWKIEAPMYNYEKSFRSKEFDSIYNEDKEFKTVTDALIKTIVGRMYKHFSEEGESYTYPIEDIKTDTNTKESSDEKKKDTKSKKIDKEGE